MSEENLNPADAEIMRLASESDDDTGKPKPRWSLAPRKRRKPSPKMSKPRSAPAHSVGKSGSII
jgi:hypothetical protein